MVARTRAPIGELVASLVVDHLDAEALSRCENARLLPRGSPHLARAWRNLGRATGAVDFETGTAVGAGCNPKLELLSWLSRKSAFLLRPGSQDSASPQAFQLNASPTNRTSLTLVQTLPAVAPQNELPVVAGQLPRQARPLVPLAYGVGRGRPMYAEFRFTWEERGNGEACQLAVTLGSGQAAPSHADDLLLLFSPSAGAVFQRVTGGPSGRGTLRVWPLEDLWVDAAPTGTKMCLEAGVYIQEDGMISFFRRGPVQVDGKDGGGGPRPEDLPWECAGGFDSSYRFQPAGAFPTEFHVVLCLLDTLTPLQAELLRVTDAPPARTPGLHHLQWHWKADA